VKPPRESCSFVCVFPRNTEAEGVLHSPEIAGSRHEPASSKG
jgi:hypothetical protein